MKNKKKIYVRNFLVLEDRTTLIRRRIDVMVGSPIKKSWWTWNVCGFLENCWWQTWLSPIQHEQSSSQNYQFDQKTSILKCKFVIGTRMNTGLWILWVRNFLVLEDRTTLIRRRIDVMVGSPIKKSWWTWNVCGFLENCWWQTWLSPIQHEQSSSQNYQFDQKTSILKCKFVIGTRMNTGLWNG